jgi:undecaprenyl diphosphate synthase
VQACRKAIEAGVKPDEMTEAKLSEFMAMAHAPDPDLFIRTGGEVRISNFLLWQAAYTEFVFSDCLWPEFGERELDAAIASFHERDRRFGGVKETAAAA